MNTFIYRNCIECSDAFEQASHMKSIKDQFMKSTSISVFYDSSIDNRVATVFLEGDLEIKNVDKIKKDFIAAIDRFEYLEVILKNISNIDFHFLELLKNMREAARKFNKTIVYDMELPEEIKEIIG